MEYLPFGFGAVMVGVLVYVLVFKKKPVVAPNPVVDPNAPVDPNPPADDSEG